MNVTLVRVRSDAVRVMLVYHFERHRARFLVQLLVQPTGVTEQPVLRIAAPQWGPRGIAVRAMRTACICLGRLRKPRNRTATSLAFHRDKLRRSQGSDLAIFILPVLWRSFHGQ